LPVGGLKEKLLAAARAGIVQVIVPADNARDLEQVEKKALRGLRIVLARTMDDVLNAALKPAERRELRVES
ncbi:MAG TPA: S16 family serine protease, partial [Polyangia bacterium]